MLTLYLSPGSSSMAPHIALHEVGADFTVHPLSFARLEQQAPAYLAINPTGQVPTLLIDGTTALTEVAGILFYIARRFPQAGLLPDEIEGEAQVVSWMSFLAATVHGARSGGVEKVRAAFALAEQKLGGREWAVGDRLSIADIHLFRLFWRFRGAFDLPIEALPGLVAHHDRMMLRPAVIRTREAEAAIGYELPGLQPGAVSRPATPAD